MGLLLKINTNCFYNEPYRVCIQSSLLFYESCVPAQIYHGIRTDEHRSTEKKNLDLPLKNTRVRKE